MHGDDIEHHEDHKRDRGWIDLLVGLGILIAVTTEAIQELSNLDGGLAGTI
jgi:hypothetical protein